MGRTSRGPTLNARTSKRFTPKGTETGHTPFQRSIFLAYAASAYALSAYAFLVCVITAHAFTIKLGHTFPTPRGVGWSVERNHLLFWVTTLILMHSKATLKRWVLQQGFSNDEVVAKALLGRAFRPPHGA
jgi:hypothetical protein